MQLESAIMGLRDFSEMSSDMSVKVVMEKPSYEVWNWIKNVFDIVYHYHGAAGPLGREAGPTIM